MNGNSILVDTNIIIDVFDGNKRIADKLNELPIINISSTVLGELCVGINRVINKEKHLKRLQKFLQLCSVLDVDIETARYYGEIVTALFKKGKPIPSNNVRIAATALQHDLLLISNDKYFKGVEGLRYEGW